jgi:hypothetical protein
MGKYGWAIQWMKLRQLTLLEQTKISHLAEEMSFSLIDRWPFRGSRERECFAAASDGSRPSRLAERWSWLTPVIRPTPSRY